MKRHILLACLLTLGSALVHAQRVNSERTLNVDGTERTYILYVPDSAAASPALVLSLHGASCHATDRSPFRPNVAEQAGCIVAYPQGRDQMFQLLGARTTGWKATGEANEDLDFFRAIIEDVAHLYPIDRTRIYCCGFSNGGMMTYAMASCATNLFAAYASISGFPLNEFHHRPTGSRPVPFLHIHGKADNFVPYALTPVIRDNMVARNGCSPCPIVSAEPGRHTRYDYEAEPGGQPYVFIEIDGMGHEDRTDKTAEGSAALTMWNFMSRHRLTDIFDSTLKWRAHLDAQGFVAEEHGWTVSADGTRLVYGTPKKADNLDHNVYPALALEAGSYELRLDATGGPTDTIQVEIATLDGSATLLRMAAAVGQPAVATFATDAFAECRISLTKTSPAAKVSSLAIHARERDARSGDKR